MKVKKRVQAHAYVMPLEDGSMLKIGRAHDFTTRHKQLEKSWGKFDLERSFIISSIQNWSSHTMLEYFLHHTFDGYRINDLPRVRQGDGSSEFFEIECFDEVKNLCEIYVDIRSRHDKVTKITADLRNIDSVFEMPYKKPN